MDSRVADEHVQATESADGLVHRGRQRGEVADVSQSGRRAHAALLHRGGGLREVGSRRGHIHRDHVGALLGEPLAMAATDPATGAGNQHYPSAQTRHQRALTKENPL